MERSTEPVECDIDWQDYNLTDDEVSGLSTSFDTTVYNIEDLWQDNAKKAKVGNTKKSLKVTVPGHDVAMYRLTPNKK